MSKNEVTAWLGKHPADFTREDIVRFIAENGVEMVNFMYPAADGRRPLHEPTSYAISVTRVSKW